MFTLSERHSASRPNYINKSRKKYVSGAWAAAWLNGGSDERIKPSPPAPPRKSTKSTSAERGGRGAPSTAAGEIYGLPKSLWALWKIEELRQTESFRSCNSSRYIFKHSHPVNAAPVKVAALFSLYRGGQFIGNTCPLCSPCVYPRPSRPSVTGPP